MTDKFWLKAKLGPCCQNFIFNDGHTDMSLCGHNLVLPYKANFQVLSSEENVWRRRSMLIFLLLSIIHCVV